MSHRPLATITKLLLLLLWWSPLHSMEVDEFNLSSDDHDDLTITRYYAEQSRQLLIWLPSEYGDSPRHRPTAETLVTLGFEVWVVNIHQSWFLPPGPGSLAEVPTSVVPLLLNAGLARFSGSMTLMAPGRTALLALQGVEQWQSNGHADPRLNGVLLLHPKLYLTTPQGGEAAQYHPTTASTNLPIYIMQPTLSSGYWRITALAQQLGTGGSPVYIEALPQASDGFNLRPDFTPSEAALTQQLPTRIDRALRRLARHGGTPLHNSSPTQTATIHPRPVRRELLQPYSGNHTPPPLQLPLLNGTPFMGSSDGKVTLVNFWATWCPPCVEEIPSLNRLYQRLGPKGLEVIGIDVGESPQQVQAFTQRMAVAFPLLIDTEGSAFRDWQVYAFPTTFILDRHGAIRYAVYGGMDWAATEVIERLEALIDEQ